MTINIKSYFIFYFLYISSELFIQRNMFFPNYIRWYLSDVFGSSCITSTLLFYVFVNNKNYLLLIPAINMSFCIIYELFLSKTDIIDIYCYIGGTIMYYLTCIKR